MSDYEKPTVTDAACFDCGEPAEFRYAWPWGEHGYSCAGCVPKLRATASKLSREVDIVSLIPPTTPPPAMDLRKELEAADHEIKRLHRFIDDLQTEAQHNRNELDDLRKQVVALQGGAVHA